MKTTNNTYETGAINHAVNDLILFTDNTRHLAKLRDSIYNQSLNINNTDRRQWLVSKFNGLYIEARETYKKEFPRFLDHQHIVAEVETWGVHKGKFTHEQFMEYCMLYADNFEHWKTEHGKIQGS